MLLLASVFLIACMTLGGGTHQGHLSDAALQALSIPVLLRVLWHGLPSSNSVRLAFAFCLTLVAVPLLQLIPLAPDWLPLTPLHETHKAIWQSLGMPLPWLPISTVPRATALAGLALLPPITMFAVTLQLNVTERRRLCLVIVGIGMLSVTLGLVQLAQGPLSPLRFYRFTNELDAVGFFANRNHFSALIYSLLVLVATWIPDGTSPSRRAAVARPPLQPVVIYAALFGVMVVLLGAQTMARSRAGLALTFAALLGIFAMTAASRRLLRGNTTRRALVSGLVVSVILVGQFASLRMLERLSFDPFADGRLPYARNTLAAAKAYFPFGAGVGTFPTVYAASVPLADEERDTVANRAHNDGLETLLEAGVFSAVLIAAFLIWWILRTWRIWWPRQKAAAADIDPGLAKAASIIIALLLIHSIADYPLRTSALLSLFAVACAMLLPAQQPAPRQ
jgi:O-antigen ligase